MLKRCYYQLGEYSKWEAPWTIQTLQAHWHGKKISTSMNLPLLGSLTLLLRNIVHPYGLLSPSYTCRMPLIYLFAAMPCDLLLCLAICRIAHRQVSHSQWLDPLVKTPPSTPGHDFLGSCQMGKSSMKIFTGWNGAKRQAVLWNQHGFGDTMPLMSKRLGGIYGNPAVADGDISLLGYGNSHLSLGSLSLNTV